jgi:hypothetical protein
VTARQPAASPGPAVAELVRWLSECPEDFLQPPRLGGKGKVHVEAVVSDLLRALGGPPLDREDAAALQRADLPAARASLIGAWLLHHPSFRGRLELAAKARAFLTLGLAEAAAIVEPSRFVTDPDRREELARLALAALGLLPEGESAAAAQDRLSTLSSVERQRVLRETRAAQERIRQIREAMAKKAAEEAAAKYTRE